MLVCGRLSISWMDGVKVALGSRGMTVGIYTIVFKS